MADITNLYKETLKRYDLKIKECKVGSFEQDLSIQYEEMLRNLSEKIIGKALNIKIYWIDSYSINASVVKIQDTYCIGLYSGITSALIDHINYYYRDGISDFEGIEFPQINAFYDVTEEDSLEGKLGNYIFTMSLLYLVMHEFGHILSGHCESEDDFFMLFEELKIDEGNYFQQAKEYIADFYGIANSYDYFLPSCVNHLEDFVLITMLYITAVHTLFWIFAHGYKNISDTDCSKLTHPHPVVRMTYFFSLIENELRFMLNVFEQENKMEYSADNQAEKIVDEAAVIFFRILSRTEIDFNIEDTLSDLCDSEMMKINEAIEKVKDFYMKKSYVEYV